MYAACAAQVLLSGQGSRGNFEGPREGSGWPPRPPKAPYETAQTLISLIIRGMRAFNLLVDSSSLMKPHPASSSLIKPHQASSSLIRTHQSSSSLIKPHQASSSLIKPHQFLSSLVKPHQASSNLIKPHQTSVLLKYCLVLKDPGVLLKDPGKGRGALIGELLVVEISAGLGGRQPEE